MQRHSLLSIIPILSLMVISLAISPATVHAMTYYTIKAGDWGDISSIGNTGVQVQIRTHIYSIGGDDWDSYWVGTDLSNGAFIQVGYLYDPGAGCLEGFGTTSTPQHCTGSTDEIGPSDARWFWQYWPNGSQNVFYWGIGPRNSAGVNGTWHTYTIEPNSANYWTIVVDNQT